MNEVDPPQRQAANVLGSFVAHSTQEQVEPESSARSVGGASTPKTRRRKQTRRFTCLQTSWRTAGTVCTPHGTTAGTENTAASSGTTCTHTCTHTLTQSLRLGSLLYVRLCLWNSLSRAAAVTVTLLLIGSVLRVPVQMLHVVRYYLFHGPQGLGEWTFLQSSTFLCKHTGNSTDITVCAKSSKERGAAEAEWE